MIKYLGSAFQARKSYSIQAVPHKAEGLRWRVADCIKANTAEWPPPCHYQSAFAEIAYIIWGKKIFQLVFTSSVFKKIITKINKKSEKNCYL